MCASTWHAQTNRSAHKLDRIILVRFILWGYCLRTTLCLITGIWTVWAKQNDAAWHHFVHIALPAFPACPSSVPPIEKEVEGLPGCQGHSAPEELVKGKSGLVGDFFFTTFWCLMNETVCECEKVYLFFFLKRDHPCCYTKTHFYSWKWQEVLFIFSLQDKFISNNLLFTDPIWKDRCAQSSGYWISLTDSSFLV